ncbi:MAG: TRAP transporter substrate-binding protein DctP [Rhodomicrobium sp.]
MQFRLLALISLLACQFLAKPASAEALLLRISLQQPISNPIGQNLTEFKHFVEEKTHGAVKVDIYDKAQFYLDYQVPEAVSSGAIEMGVAPLAQYAEDVPAAGLFMQPFLFNFGAIVRAAAARRGEIRSAIDAEIEKKSRVRVLWWQPYGPNVILGKGSLANPQAIAKHNVRVFDDVSAEFIRLCGGNPEIISDAKQSEAFDMNIIDSSVASIASVKDEELWRKIDTITNIRHSENLFLVVINQKSFESLSVEQQRIVMEAAEKAEKDIWSKFHEIETEPYQFAASKGIKIQELVPDDTVAWRICSSNILESYMERAGGLGARLFAAYGRLRADPCCSVQASVAGWR